MAQATDYNLANQTGADFRAELNEILAASVSLNSGSSEPTTMYAHQLWVDTSSNVLKIRNAANNAWLTTGVSITASNTFDINAGTVNGITSLSFSSGATVASILDEDNLSSDSATALATQQSIKAYVDSQVTAQDLDITDGSSTIAIDLDSETLSLLGGTGITSTASGNGVTFAIGQSVGTSDNVVFNQVTGALVGNASTATTLATARTISGVSFDGSANITLDTDDIGEGSNKYFTAERVDDQVNTLLTAGANISLTYNDTAGTLTIANTNSADITSVVAGDGLTGGGTSGAVTLAVGVDDSSIEINSDALRVKASGITNAMLGGSIANNKLANSSVTINSNSLSLGGTLTLDTDDIGEGSSNLYYTTARANSAIDARVTNTFINNLSGVVADTATALATARTIALSGDVVGSVSFDGTSDVTISSTIQANSVALGTDTTGNYVATITGTANKVSVSGSGSETAGVTLSLPDDVQIADSLTVAGNLTVNGDLTYLDTTNLKIEDNLFELNANLTGSPVNDSGMLINRGNQNNGVFMWDESADKFTMGLTTADGTSTGNITLASLGTLVANLEGNVTGNVSGTAATVTGAAQTAITSVGSLSSLDVGTVTSTGNLVLNQDSGTIFIGADLDLRITHSGSAGTITNNTGNLTLDVAGDIKLDADSSNIYLADGGTDIGLLSTNNQDLNIRNLISDKDIYFQGRDGSSTITALTLDMSDAGTAIFNHDVKLGDNGKAVFGAGADLQIYHDGSNSIISDEGTGGVKIFTAGVATSGFYKIGGEKLATFEPDGAVTLYHNNSAKLATTSTGIAVTGTATMDGLTLGDNTTSEIPIYFNSNSTDFSVGANGNNFILAQTTGDLDTNQLLTVTSSGNVGIATTSPASKLHIFDGGSSVNNTITFGNPSATAKAEIHHTAGGSEFLNISCKGTTSGHGNITFNTGSTPSEAMRIDSSNNVGIGNSSPTTKLDVTGDGLQIRLDGTANTSRGIMLRNTGSAEGQIQTDGNMHFIQEDAGKYMRFSTANTERMRIDSSGNVGIGNTNPNLPLTITSNSGANALAIRARSADDYGFMQFYNHAGSALRGQIYNHNGAIGFSTSSSGTERMRLDASGSLLVGKTEDGTSNAGHVFFGTGAAYHIRDGGFTNFFNRTSSDGEILRFAKDGTTVGSIGTNSGYLVIGSPVGTDAHLLIGNDLIHPATSTGSAKDAAIDIGAAINRFKNLYLSGNIQMGGNLDVVGQVSSYDNVNSAYTTMNLRATDFIYKNGGGSEKMRLDSSGNVLVGQTTASSGTVGTSLRADGRAFFCADGNYAAHFNRNTSDGAIAHFAKDDTIVGSIGSNSAGGVPVLDISTNTSSGIMRFLTSNNERVRIDASGNVGIGVTPSAKLHINLGTDKNLLFAGNIGEIGSVAGFQAVNDAGSALGSFGIRATDMRFATGSSERMRIDSSGVLLLKKTSTSVNVAGGYIDGGEAIMSISSGANTYLVRNTSTSAYSFYVSGAGQIHAVQTSISSLSDERLKDNIVDIDTGLSEVMALKPRKFDWKEGEGSNEKNVVGFVAQEVETVLPDLIGDFKHDDLDDAKSVKMGDMIPTLVKAIQEQQTQIEELKAEIQNLKGE